MSSVSGGAASGIISAPAVSLSIPDSGAPPYSTSNLVVGWYDDACGVIAVRSSTGVDGLPVEIANVSGEGYIEIMLYASDTMNCIGDFSLEVDGVEIVARTINGNGISARHVEPIIGYESCPHIIPFETDFTIRTKETNEAGAFNHRIFYRYRLTA